MHHTSKIKLNSSNYYMFILVLWYSIEMLLGTTFEGFGGVSASLLNQLQKYIVLGLLLFQIVFFKAYTKKELFLIAVCLIPFSISGLLSHSYRMLSFLLFVIASKDIDFDRIVKMIYYLNLVLIPCIILLCLVGFLDDTIVFRGLILRHALGFEHPNTLGQRIFSLVACHIYIRFYKLNVWDYFFVIAACIFCYFVPNSQTASMLLIAVIIGTFIYKGVSRWSNCSILIKGLLVISAFCNVASVFLICFDFTKYSWFLEINNLLSRRFWSSHIVLQIYGITWLGKRVYITGQERALVGMIQNLYSDNAYGTLLIRYGIIVYILFSAMYLYNMNIQIKKKKTALVFFLCLYAICGVMENSFLSMSLNIFLLSIKSIFYKENNLKENKGNQ